MTLEFNRSFIYSTDDSNWASAEITFVSEIYSIPTPQSRDNPRWISHSSSRIFSFLFSPLQCFLPPHPSQSSVYSVITSLWPCLSHLRSIHQIAQKRTRQMCLKGTSGHEYNHVEWGAKYNETKREFSGDWKEKKILFILSLGFMHMTSSLSELDTNFLFGCASMIPSHLEAMVKDFWNLKKWSMRYSTSYFYCFITLNSTLDLNNHLRAKISTFRDCQVQTEKSHRSIPLERSWLLKGDFRLLHLSILFS